MLTNIPVSVVVDGGGGWCTVMEAELGCKEDQHGTADWVASVPSWSSSQPHSSDIDNIYREITHQPEKIHQARSLTFVMKQCSPSLHN